MATLRKGKCYRNSVRAFTRKSKFKKKGYIKAIPPSKVARYDMGDLKKKFSNKVILVSDEKVQLRHNSLESCRQIVNRNLVEKLGPKGYYFHVNIYPHHVLRENKMLAGAHADRLQTGMAHSFGRTVGTAAQLKKGTVIFSIFVDSKDVETARTSLNRSKPRMTGRTKIEVLSV